MAGALHGILVYRRLGRSGLLSTHCVWKGSTPPSPGGGHRYRDWRGWLILSYLVAKSTEPDVDFIYTQAFASFAAFGVLTLVAERYFGHPFFQSENDVGPRLLARSERRQGHQHSWLDKWL